MTRKEAIDWLKAISFVSDKHITEALNMAIEALSVANLKSEFESADAVQGEWEFVDNEIFAGEYFCSICGKRAEVDLYGEWILSDYCPNCGAKMTPYKGGDEYEKCVEQMEHDIMYEPTYNQDDGSM